MNLMGSTGGEDKAFMKLVRTELPNQGTKGTESKKHVFVMFFLNGCGPCNNMKGTWVELAAKNNAQKDVLVCAIESRNVQKINPSVTGFPTFCYYGPNRAAVNTFSGNRDKEGLQAWIHGHVHVHSHSGKHQGGTRKQKKPKKQKKTRKQKKRSRHVSKWTLF